MFVIFLLPSNFDVTREYSRTEPKFVQKFAFSKRYMYVRASFWHEKVKSSLNNNIYQD